MILALDISTSITGVTVLDYNGKVLLNEAWHFKRCKTFYEKVSLADDKIRELHNNPDSRRMVVSAWNPADMKDMALPPCHYGFQCYVNDRKLDLMWQQRSVDVFLGLPYDIAMYGLLLELLAKGHGLKPGRLIGQLGDCHLYNNHLDAAKTIMYRDPSIYDCPTLELDTSGVYINHRNQINIPELDMMKLHNYKHMGEVKAPLNVGN